MVMFQEKDFEDIRPYHDEEINPALNRIVAVPEFFKILDFFGQPSNEIPKLIFSSLGKFTILDSSIFVALVRAIIQLLGVSLIVEIMKT